MSCKAHGQESLVQQSLHILCRGWQDTIRHVQYPRHAVLTVGQQLFYIASRAPLRCPDFLTDDQNL